MGLSRRKEHSPLAFAHKRIGLRQQNNAVAKEIQSEFGLNPVMSKILAARNFAANEELKNFLNPTLQEGMPHPDELKNLSLACELLHQVVSEGGSVAICCDFDVDGLSGGSQVHDFFKSIGVTSKVFVPDRFTEGYGLNEEMIRTIAAEGFSVLIAIDYGTSNARELELARAHNVKTVVIDHHHVGAIQNPADVFINPQQDGCGFADGILCAAGLAWYLIAALRKVLPGAESVDPREYLDLACLGTICDMVPLKGPNRVIARKGLEYLGSTRRPGLRELKNVIGLHKEISGSHVSFGIGPRINAAGRMLSGELVIELLTTRDSKKASKLAKKLNTLNLERQDIEARVKESATAMIEDSGVLPWGIVVWDKEFHTGVIGIVAQRLVESFYRPSVVMGADDTGMFKGSVRGIKGFSVVDALDETSEFLEKFGGHEGAGGFSVQEKHIQDFAEAFNRVCFERLKELEIEPLALADTVTDLEDITLELVEDLKTFAPFGIGNPGALVLIENVIVKSLSVLKGEHLKVLLSDGERYITGMMWKTADHPALTKGARVNVVGRPDVNTYRGMSELQLVIQAAELVQSG